jgi:hypothetical protein
MRFAASHILPDGTFSEIILSKIILPEIIRA